MQKIACMHGHKYTTPSLIHICPFPQHEKIIKDSGQKCSEFELLGTIISIVTKECEEKATRSSTKSNIQTMKVTCQRLSQEKRTELERPHSFSYAWWNRLSSHFPYLDEHSIWEVELVWSLKNSLAYNSY